ncbi:Nn.00g117270.m01.CDS01 [Neocucurbitaria sp. VM-36]
MDPSKAPPKAPAIKRSRFPTLGDNTRIFGAPFPQQPQPSPPQEHNAYLPLLPTTRPNGLPYSPEPLDPEIHRPLTPPHQEDEEYGPLTQWYAQQGVAHNSSGIRQQEPQYQQGNTHLSALPQQQQQLNNATWRPGGHPGMPHNGSYIGYWPEALPSEPLQYRNGLPIQYHGLTARQPSIAPFSPPAPIQSRYTVQPQTPIQAPPIQQWPTHNLAYPGDQSELAVSNAPSVPLSSSRSGRPDAKTRRKQEKYRRKGEAKRQANAAHTRYAAREDDRRMAPGFQRKSSGPKELPKAPTPPRLHPQLSNYAHNNDAQDTDLGGPMDWDSSPVDYAPDTYMPVQAPTAYQPFRHTSLPPVPEEQPAPLDWDNMDQLITKTYEDYKWSVKLYQLDPKMGYDFAQAFVEDLFRLSNLYEKNSGFKWHAHASKGFIEGGDHLSIIVLHNAANPFTWGPDAESTTTVGVYGRYGHLHETEIYWKTFAPNIREKIDAAMYQGYFKLKYKWHIDMEKASEKRFHRAYWLAANMLPLKGLLNHGMGNGRPHDYMYDDEEVNFTAADLQSYWDDEVVSEQDSERAWQNILLENEGSYEPEHRHEHIETGCSEWDL